VRRKRIFIVFAVCVFVGIGAVALWPSEKEPEYNGKNLSHWLKAYLRPGALPVLIETDADDAVRQIGTNALPFLVKWIQVNPKSPAWRVNLYNFVCYRTPNSRVKYPILEMIDAPGLRSARAMRAFEILGPQARAAVPDLVRIAKNGRADTLPALKALGYVGADALPALLAFAGDKTFKYRVAAIEAIGQVRYLGTNAHSTVLCLTNCLEDQDIDINVAVEAAVVLGGLGIESEISVPAFAQCLHSRDAALRCLGVMGLEKFSESARSAVPDLQDTDDYVRSCATIALRKIAPEVLTNSVKNF
jgi:hypothetical protein